MTAQPRPWTDRDAAGLSAAKPGAILEGFTARAANALLERKGTFWHRDYFDRYIRDDAHLAAVMRYIDNNPVRAGLVEHAADWPFGSAGFGSAGFPAGCA